VSPANTGWCGAPRGHSAVTIIAPFKEITVAAALSSPRLIDQRFKPAVGGIDLEQSLNYIAVADAGEAFCYERYTGSRLPYKPGRRPALERIAREATAGTNGPREAALRLNKWVAKNVAWAGYHCKQKGKRLTTDLALSEEALVDQGFGWCNEQARVLCCLTQVMGIPSRIVFACDRDATYGHCVTEVLLPAGWLMLDQSFGYALEIDREPVRAIDVFGEPRRRAHFEPIYKQMCEGLLSDLGHSVLDKDFAMSVAPNPLDGFALIGFHNHFVH
jgi:transglutaminase-like putative cysteine protease